MLADRRHHLANLVIAQKSRRAAAEVQLLYDLLRSEQHRLHGHLLDQVSHVLARFALVLGDDFVAGTVKAKRVAEWNMDI